MKKTSYSPGFSKKLSRHARNILRISCDIARAANAENVQPAHLFSAVILEKNSLGNLILRQLGVDESCVADIVSHRSEIKRPLLSPPPIFSQETRDIVAHAFLLAHQFSYPYVGSEHFVHALANSKDSTIISLLSKKTGSNDEQKGNESTEPPASSSGFPEFSRLFDFPPFRFLSEKGSGNEDLSAIEQFGIPLGENASSFSLRKREIEGILRTLSRKTKSNPLLIGDPGVGKTALVEEIARLMREGKAGRALEGKQIVLLDLASIVAGTSFRGEFEARIKDIIQEAKERPEIIFFLDEIHTIIGAGNASGGLDASNILKPALARGDLRCIGATTFAEYKRHIEKDSALERRFQVIRISEPTPEESIRILKESRESYEKHHDVTIEDGALSAAVHLSIRHLPGRFLPDKAFDLLDEAAALLRRAETISATHEERQRILRAIGDLSEKKQSLIRDGKFPDAEIAQKEEISLQKELQNLEQSARHAEHKKKRPTLTGDAIAEAAALISDTPVERITDEITSRIQSLFPKLSGIVFGQDEALHTLADAVSRSSLGLGSSMRRPRGSFLFLGPSGSGKTLSARALAENLFGKKQSFLRLDMSEFRERHHMAQLLGSPAGYVGYGEGGRLTEHLRHHPASVILFDEIEKAHPDILSLLLQILEEGTLTDAEGRSAHFSESFVILTSNIGSHVFDKDRKLGFGLNSGTILSQDSEDRFALALEEARKEIKPEIMSRLDRVIVFQSLKEEDLRKIADQEILTIKTKLLSHKVTLSIPKDASSFIAKKSLGHRDGARSVRASIRTHIEDPLSRHLFSKKRFPEKVRFILTKDSLCIRL